MKKEKTGDEIYLMLKGVLLEINAPDSYVYRAIEKICDEQHGIGMSQEGTDVLKNEYKKFKTNGSLEYRNIEIFLKKFFEIANNEGIFTEKYEDIKVVAELREQIIKESDEIETLRIHTKSVGKKTEINAVMQEETSNPQTETDDKTQREWQALLQKYSTPQKEQGKPETKQSTPQKEQDKTETKQSTSQKEQSKPRVKQGTNRTEQAIHKIKQKKAQMEHGASKIKQGDEKKASEEATQKNPSQNRILISVKSINLQTDDQKNQLIKYLCLNGFTMDELAINGIPVYMIEKENIYPEINAIISIVRARIKSLLEISMDNNNYGENIAKVLEWILEEKTDIKIQIRNKESNVVNVNANAPKRFLRIMNDCFRDSNDNMNFGQMVFILERLKRRGLDLTNNNAVYETYKNRTKIEVERLMKEMELKKGRTFMD